MLKITMIIKVLFAQVLSPITSQVLGNATIEVTKNKETITGLKVRGISIRAVNEPSRRSFPVGAFSVIVKSSWTFVSGINF